MSPKLHDRQPETLRGEEKALEHANLSDCGLGYCDIFISCTIILNNILTIEIINLKMFCGNIHTFF